MGILQAKGDKDMSSSGFAARAQSAADRNDNAGSGSNSSGNAGKENNSGGKSQAGGK